MQNGRITESIQAWTEPFHMILTDPFSHVWCFNNYMSRLTSVVHLCCFITQSQTMSCIECSVSLCFLVSEPHNPRLGFSDIYFCPILTMIFKIYRHHLQVPLGQLLNLPLLPHQGYILYLPSLYTLVQWCFLCMYVCMYVYEHLYVYSIYTQTHKAWYYLLDLLSFQII